MVHQLVNPVTVVVFELRASKHDWPMLPSPRNFLPHGEWFEGGRMNILRAHRRRSGAQDINVSALPIASHGAEFGRTPQSQLLAARLLGVDWDGK